MKKIIEQYPRDFEGVWIPKEIYLNENLNALDKIIFAEINSLDRHLEEGGDYCYASNEYLANFCGCGVTKVSTVISKLRDMGYLKIVKTDGRKRWITSCYKSCLSKFERQTNKICESDNQIPKESNISNITTNNINKIEYNRCIPKRNSTFDFSIVENQIDTVCKEDTRFNSECVKEIFRYYYKQYYRWFGKHHPKISNKNLKDIFNRIYDSEYFDCFTLSGFKEMIDRHFMREYGRKIDYNINHFMTPGILDRLCDEIAS